MRREGEYDSSNESRMVSDDDSSGERRMVSVGDIPCPLVESAEVPDHEGTEPENGGTQAQGELRVYTRRRKQNEEVVPTVPLVPSPLSLPPLTSETSTPSTSDSEYTGDMIPLSPPTLLSIRRTSRSNAGVPPDRYSFLHDIAQFVFYSNISPVHEAFIASLDIVFIPKCWQVAKDDSKWKAVMLEELGALDKNKTWELVSLPPGKKAVGCKWVFTVKQNPKGRVERYKA
jgi:hypothetical protein